MLPGLNHGRDSRQKSRLLSEINCGYNLLLRLSFLLFLSFFLQIQQFHFFLFFFRYGKLKLKMLYNYFAKCHQKKQCDNHLFSSNFNFKQTNQPILNCRIEQESQFAQNMRVSNIDH